MVVVVVVIVGRKMEWNWLHKAAVALVNIDSIYPNHRWIGMKTAAKFGFSI